MQDNISPEERLLRLIRKDKRKEAPRDIQSFSRQKEPPAQTPAVAEQPSAQKKTAKIKGISFTMSFSQINRLLIAAILILGIYLLVDFVISAPQRIEERILELGVGRLQTKELESADKAARQEQALSDYKQPVSSRELFTTSGVETMQLRPTPTFMEMVSKLRLQGIISGDNPQAVIEDSATKQVYFLSTGGYIGDIELKQILPGKVILSYHGQEVELTL